MLTRFRVQNYKCLGDVDIPLTPLHVLIGQNDAGKTSVLEAMYAACRTRDVVFTESFPFGWKGTSLVRHGAAESFLAFELEFDVRPHLDYRLEFDIDPNGVCKRVAERIHRGGKLIDLSSVQTDRPDFTAVNYARRNPQQFKADAPDVKAAGDAIPSVGIYAFNPEMMALPAQIHTPPDSTPLGGYAWSSEAQSAWRLDRDGFGLSALIDEIKDFEDELFPQIRQEFCRLYPHFTNIRLKKEQGCTRPGPRQGVQAAAPTALCKGIYFVTRDGSEVPASLASAGAILLLGFLALAHMPNPPGLLLIEEPETGIYPERLKEVVGLMQRFVAEHTEPVPLQLVITTHSPYLLDMFEPEQVTFLRRGEDDAVSAFPLRDAPHIGERLAGGAFHLGELWYNLSEEELFADAT